MDNSAIICDEVIDVGVTLSPKDDNDKTNYPNKF